MTSGMKVDKPFNWYPMKHILFIVLIILLASCFMPPHTHAALTRYWAVDDSEKIMRQDINHPLANSPENPIWNGQQISLFGAQNEIVAFQLILEADNNGAQNVNVVFDALSSPTFSIDNHQAVAPTDPYNYVGKNIELFTESYLNIDVRTGKCLTTGAWGYSGIQGNYAGWVPDALVPFQAPPGTNGSPGGAPFAISPHSNQAVWVDINIPKNAPAGTYRGTLEITLNANPVAQIPIDLTVYNFSLPDVTHLNNYFWFGGYEANFVNRFGVAYRSTAYFPIEGNYMKLFHRHRMNLLTNVDYTQMTSGTIPYQRYIIDGPNSWFTPQNGYTGPGEAIGNPNYILGKYNSWRAGFPTASGTSYCKPCGTNTPPADGVCNTREWWQQQAACWVNWFTATAPQANYALHIPPDEPPPVNYSSPSASFVQHLDWLNGTNLPRLVTLIGFPLGSDKTPTNPYPSPYPYLTNNIEYWGLGTFTNYFHPPGSYWGGDFGKYEGYQPEYVASQHNHNKKVFIYNGAIPWSGTAVIDSDATNFRVTPWVAWKYGVDAYSYYHVSDYTVNDASGQGEKSNPFVNNYKLYSSGTTGSCSLEGYKPNWGSGSLVYPGTNYDPDLPGSNVPLYGNLNLPGPVASIRMKNWRRGAQDFEYLYLAKAVGHQAEVDQLVNTLIPRALYDRDEHSHPGWPDVVRPPADWPARGYAFESTRRQLATLIDPSTTPAPPPLDGDLNQDGVVDYRDFLFLITHFSQPYTIFDFNQLASVL